jgi:nitrite reductase/ring-hydroxylating ferredoxin subunit
METIVSGWVRVCRRSDVRDEPKGFKLQDRRIAIYKVGTDFYATDDVCTHAYALLSTGFQDGHVIECPLHNATFDIRTGACLSVADKDLTTYPVKVEEEEIFVQI